MIYVIHYDELFPITQRSDEDFDWIIYSCTISSQQYEIDEKFLPYLTCNYKGWNYE